MEVIKRIEPRDYNYVLNASFFIARKSLVVCKNSFWDCIKNLLVIA